MAVYKCNGEFVTAESVREVLNTCREDIKDIKTVWSGKLKNLVIALVGEFESVSVYGRMATKNFDTHILDHDSIQEGEKLIEAMKRNIVRAEELLESLRLALSKYGYPDTSGEIILKVDDREV